MQTAKERMMGTAIAEAFCFIGCDGKTIAGTHWPSEGTPRAVVQIAHGMGEHIGRYAQTAAFLSSHGFAVLGNDHRGHGRTGVASGETGSFGDAGFDGLVADIGLLLEIGRVRYPGLPVILLAHSMGSFAAQQLILTQSDRLDGLILSGTGALDVLFRELEQLNFDAASLTNRSLAHVRTSHDWLSRDARAVDAFLGDPLCFAVIDSDAASSVARAAAILADPGALRAIRPDLPVYCIAGSLDPVGQDSAGVRLLMQRYAAAGLHNVRCDIYEGGRREMLNETNRAEVLANLLDWIERSL
jgi:alpha-beta hydrolase superfamily lysophospholipase